MTWDPVWESIFISQNWGRYPAESLIRFIMGTCGWGSIPKNNRKTIRVLEIGCGTGANVWFLAKEGFSVDAIDGSATAINILHRRLKEEGLDPISSTVGDVSELNFPNETFDAVIDNECIYANNEQWAKKIVSEIQRVLKPGGKFYSRTFSEKQSIGAVEESLARQGQLEFASVSIGPLAGKGFVRLSTKQSIFKIYGECFNSQITIDEIYETRLGGKIVISEYIVVCVK